VSFEDGGCVGARLTVTCRHNWDSKTREWVKSEERAREDEREREKMLEERKKKVTEKARLV
jgi:hypothetical protein